MKRGMAWIPWILCIVSAALVAQAGAKAAGDEFLPLDESNAVVDSASVHGEDSSMASPGQPAVGGPRKRPFFDRQLKWATIAILASVTAGFFVRFRSTRRLRILFLFASLVVLGFYNGACPCPIQSMMNFVRLLIGKTVSWKSLVYFAGLIPVTWIFGKTWCGWVCHMGALQELIHLPVKFRFFSSKRAMKAMRALRLLLFVSLIVWVAATQIAVWCRYDPFRAAYTFSSGTTAGWILLGVLIVFSLFVHRPFCRVACPIGLVLGWITRIPGASVLGLGKACPVCLSCEKACRINAIVQDGSSYTLDNGECVACGDCIDACRPGGINFFRKSAEHPAKYRCTRPSSCRPS